MFCIIQNPSHVLSTIHRTALCPRLCSKKTRQCLETNAVRDIVNALKTVPIPRLAALMIGISFGITLRRIALIKPVWSALVSIKVAPTSLTRLCVSNQKCAMTALPVSSLEMIATACRGLVVRFTTNSFQSGFAIVSVYFREKSLSEKDLRQ